MKRFLLFLLIAFSVTACRQADFHLNYEKTNELPGLASPILLEPGTNKILTEDFFMDVDKIDSVSWDYPPALTLSKDQKILQVNTSDKLPALFEIVFWIDGCPYSIPVKKSEKEWVKITFDPSEAEIENVSIAGEINGWNPAQTILENKEGIWQSEILLNPGSYQYQLVVDGKWILDPANPDSVDNNIGGFNSLLKVGSEDENAQPLLFTDKIKKNNIEIGIKNEVKDILVFWQNFKLPQDFISLKDNRLFVHIPEDALALDRSFIRAWTINKDGISNEILIPLNKGKVVQNTSELNRNDHHTQILYNVFVDRFYNGNPNNDEPVDDPSILPPANYLGGDIEGITQKINEGYFTDLGINTIWVSPLVQNPKGAYGLWPTPRSKFSGYHGYWPISFTQIDYRFGKPEDLHKLVKTAHENNMNVLLDIVANHVHEEHPVYKEHPDWATNLYLPDGSLNTEKWDEHRLTTWFDVFLPTLDLSKPEVYEMLSDSAVFWIEEYDLDGFRHDATKHIPEIFWRTLTKKLKQRVMIPKNKALYQIGETYGNAELISSYVNSGELDAQFDFNVYDDALAVFARKGEAFSRLNSSLLESLKYYGDHNLMGYITGNQDRPRFVSLASGDLSFEEDTKLAGWTRKIGVSDPIGYKKLSMLTAFNMTIPGVPVVYFGDEIGDPGGNDPDNRRMMRFNGLSENETKVKETVKKLTKLRSNNIELIYGDFTPLLVEKEVYVFARTYFDKIAISVFNNSDQAWVIYFDLPERFSSTNLSANFGSTIEKTNNQIRITIEPNSFDILTKK
jgi:cyclomaltodextrinase / maltogenic alpha-amylase / neopullulanase